MFRNLSDRINRFPALGQGFVNAETTGARIRHQMRPRTAGFWHILSDAAGKPMKALKNAGNSPDNRGGTASFDGEIAAMQRSKTFRMISENMQHKDATPGGGPAPRCVSCPAAGANWPSPALALPDRRSARHIGRRHRKAAWSRNGPCCSRRFGTETCGHRCETP